MVKYLVMDVDGTLTDGKIYMGQHGELMKAFNIKDGYGIHDIAIPAGLIPVVITGRKSDMVKNRCMELGITCFFQGVNYKIEKLKEVVDDLSTVAYIGDDLNDMSCMIPVKKAGGVVGCPADASKAVMEVADFISNLNGGDGAVREFIDWLLNN